MANFVNEVKALSNAIEELKNGNQILPEEYFFNSVLRECVVLLEKHKYIVRAQPKANKFVKDLRGLVGQFYNSLKFFHPETTPYINEKADLKIAKLLVTKITELTSLEYTLAIGFASKLVDIIFMHEDQFNFEPGSLYSFGIFGQGKMSWITEKAIRIYNKEREDEEAQNKRVDAEIEAYEKTHNIKFGFGDEEEIQKLINNL